MKHLFDRVTISLTVMIAEAIKHIKFEKRTCESQSILDGFLNNVEQEFSYVMIQYTCSRKNNHSI